MKNKIKKNPRSKIEKLKKKPCFIVFNNFSSCIIEHIIFNIITIIKKLSFKKKKIHFLGLKIP